MFVFKEPRRLHYGNSGFGYGWWYDYTLIPVPFAGTAIGAFLGGAGGDMLGGAIYDAILREGPEKKERRRCSI